MSIAAESKPRPDHRVIAIAFISFAVLGLPGAMMNVAWSPAVRQTFGQPLHAIGAVLLVSTAGYVVGSWVSGHLTARGQLGCLLAVSALFSATGLLAAALAPNWPVFVAAGLLVGVGGGLLDGAMNIFFAATFGPRLMNWLHAAFGVGATLAPLAMTAILESGGSWRLGDGLAAVCCVAVALLFALTRQRWTLTPTTATVSRTPAASVGETLRLPAVWLGIGIFATVTGLEVSAGQWAFSLLSDARHLPGSIAGLCVSAYWGSFTVGRILFGLAADLVPPVTLIRRCIAGMAVGALLLGSTRLGHVAAVGLPAFGIALAPIFALMITRTQERLGPRHAPNAIGFQVAAASVGAGTLPGSAGLLAKSFGLDVIPIFLFVGTLLMAVLFEAAQRWGVAANEE